MSIDPGWLFVSIIVSGIGGGLFLYGKKQSRWPQLVAGLVLMVYTYFISSIVLMIVIAVAIIAALWWVTRHGW